MQRERQRRSSRGLAGRREPPVAHVENTSSGGRSWPYGRPAAAAVEHVVEVVRPPHAHEDARPSPGATALAQRATCARLDPDLAQQARQRPVSRRRSATAQPTWRRAQPVARQQSRSRPCGASASATSSAPTASPGCGSSACQAGQLRAQRRQALAHRLATEIVRQAAPLVFRQGLGPQAEHALHVPAGRHRAGRGRAEVGTRSRCAAYTQPHDASGEYDGCPPPATATIAAMAREKTVYTCRDCGGTNPKWLGKCPHCNAWNTLEEASPSPPRPAQEPLPGAGQGAAGGHAGRHRSRRCGAHAHRPGGTRPRARRRHRRGRRRADRRRPRHRQEHAAAAGRWTPCRAR